MRNWIGVVVAAVLAGVPAGAMAGYQTCGARVVASSVTRCPDGGLPMFHAGAVTPDRSAQAGSAQAGSARASDLFGVWHTAVGGGVWTSPSAVPGYQQLHVSPGLRSGDLTIDSGGRWVWNSWGGKTGTWRAGEFRLSHRPGRSRRADAMEGGAGSPQAGIDRDLQLVLQLSRNAVGGAERGRPLTPD